MSRFLFIVSFIVLGFSACHSSKIQDGTADTMSETMAVAGSPDSLDNNNTDNPTRLYYEKTVCFGTCPQFKLTVKADGSAFYEGINHVNLIGRYQGEMSTATLSAIMAQAKSIGFFQMDTLYNNELVTDLPSVILSLHFEEDGVHQVENRYKGPEALQSLYLIIDRWINECTWTPNKINE